MTDMTDVPAGVTRVCSQAATFRSIVPNGTSWLTTSSAIAPNSHAAASNTQAPSARRSANDLTSHERMIMALQPVKEYSYIARHSGLRQHDGGAKALVQEFRQGR